MNRREMLARFRAWREEGRPLVLATVYETAGSTYSKAGTQMLITGDGDFQGMLSGGCLEGDLAERAARVSAGGVPETVSYELGGADDELFGLGVGCDGTMRIFLQPMRSPGYRPFAAVADCVQGESPAVLATVIEGAGALSTGLSALYGQTGLLQSTGADADCAPLAAVAERTLLGDETRLERIDAGDGRALVLFARVLPPPRLLVLGAGLDAVPVVDLAARLGWRVTVRDHRPAYLAKGDFARADAAVCAPAETLAADESLDDYSAAVVMSHHLATDRQYLRALSESSISYVGLLGPRRRRRQLLSDLGEAGARLAPRVHGPAGLDIGAEGAESIALSIVAEIQAELAGKAPGGRLGPPGDTD